MMFFKSYEDAALLEVQSENFGCLILPVDGKVWFCATGLLVYTMFDFD